MAKKKNTKKGMHYRLVQFVEYMVSGGVYFWSGYLAFYIFWSVLHWSLWWAKILADIVGWSVNYGLQRFWVFSNPELSEHRVEVTGRYAAITLVDFLLDYLIVRELKVIGISPYIGQFISAGFFTFWNYAWYRWWVFPETHKRIDYRIKTLPRHAVMYAQHVPKRRKIKKRKS
jgi:putative flippase GtrA